MFQNMLNPFLNKKVSNFTPCILYPLNKLLVFTRTPIFRRYFTPLHTFSLHMTAGLVCRTFIAIIKVSLLLN